MSIEKEKKEWLMWRASGLGSSDAPVVVGCYDYCTPYQLWEQKTGKVDIADTNSYIMNRGNEMEPIARAKYEIQTGLNMPAGRFEHHEFKFLRATMDGYDISRKQGIEIKYVGKEHKSIPDKHMAQIQHQLIVTGAKSIDYVTITDDKTIKITKIEPNQNYIIEYLKKAIEFWNLVISDTPPELVDEDVRTIKGMDQIALDYLKDQQSLKDLEIKIAEKKQQLIEAMKNHAKVTFGKTGLKASKVYRKGNIDYKKIPELKGVDLEKYRGKYSSFIKLSEDA